VEDESGSWAAWFRPGRLSLSGIGVGGYLLARVAAAHATNSTISIFSMQDIFSIFSPLSNVHPV
jgi:hypothetical protein